MSDMFIKTLFINVFKKMGIELSTENSRNTLEYELLIDEVSPIFMRYDLDKERVIIMGMIETDHITMNERPALYKKLLVEALNPIKNNKPGVGMDQNSGICYSYFELPRQTLNENIICQKLSQLIEWNKAVLIH